MNINYLKVLIFFLVMFSPVYGQSSEAIYHQSEQMLFQVIENGVVSGQIVSLKFNANEVNNIQWAECLITIITPNNTTKHLELQNWYTSSSTGDLPTIKNLDISSKAISFEMIPFPLAPNRFLRFVATRKGSESSMYQANVVGLWKGLLDETKLLKIEWCQVQSIELPFSTLGQ